MADMWAQVSYEAADEDPVVVDEAMRSLAAELDHVPGVRLEPAESEPSPDGARGIDPATIQGILVCIPAAVAAVQSVLAVLRAWQRRRSGKGRLKVRIGDDQLELDIADQAAAARVVEAWLAVRRTGDEA